MTISLRTLPSAAATAGRGVFRRPRGRAGRAGGGCGSGPRGQPKVVLVEGEGGIGKSALLARFASGLAGATVLRASGDEAELLLPYGMVGQLLASARGAGGGPPGLLAAELSDGVDPLAVGADLVAWFGQFRGMVLAVIDDLQWADGPSARALLFAVRRLHADQVLVVVSARPGELSRLGEGWQRFLAGDHRAGRVRLGGLGPADVVALGRALGAGELPRRAVGRLLEHTGGNPLYCRAVLEEAGIEGLDRPGGALGVPRSLAGMVLLRVGSLSLDTRELVAAAAVLGHHCELAAAAALAGLGDPLPALGEAVAAGILAEQPGGATAGIGFSHLLVQRAVYGDLSPARRHRLHQRAAGLVDRDRALGHRVAAAAGPDDGLAGELEAAGRQALDLGRTAQAAAWLAQAAAASSDPAAADRRLLDALEILVTYGEVAEADILAARVAAAGPGARRSGLLGALDFLAGRAGCGRGPAAGGVAGPRSGPGRVRGRRGRHPAGGIVPGRGPDPGGDRMGRAGGRGRRRPGCRAPPGPGRAGDRPFCPWPGTRGPGPAGVPARRPRRGAAGVHRHARAARHGQGLGRRPGRGDRRPFHRGGKAARRRPAARRQPVPEPPGGRRVPPRLLGRRRHARRAGRLPRPGRRPGMGLGYLHTTAAVVPALRGDWEVASAHVRMATEAAQAVGDVGAISAAATARAFLATARGDLEGVADAAAALRATGGAEFLSLQAGYNWRSLEIDALIGLARLGQAEKALAELEGPVPGRAAVGPGGRRPAARRPGRRGR